MEENQRLLERILDGAEDPTQLPLALLQDITNGFSEERKIGEGGFGEVYKGVLGERIVAVKRFHINRYTIDDKLFRRALTSQMYINHQNVVRVLGFCSSTHKKLIETDSSRNVILANVLEKQLCFEYISCGSLDKYITDELGGLEWETRYEIITGICKGLRYLHEEINIIHMDLKPSNILLDHHDAKYMVPKITDFGLSILNENSHTMDQRFGTRGYSAPEYLMHGKTSFKSDIYSLGIIIMELVTGHKDVPNKDNVLRRWRHRWNKPPTQLKYQQVTRSTIIAERCMELNPEARPSISEIINFLSESGSTHGKISPGLDEDEMLQIKPFELRLPFEFNQGEASGLVMAMTYQELLRITDGFSEKRLIGKGGFGMVYMGVHDDGQLIAVKKLHGHPGLAEDSFKNELQNLMRVQHKNIIRLVGYCSENREKVVEYNGEFVVAVEQDRALCLEYMQGGTLENLISDESCGSDWEARYKIIEGVCQGLKHLHTGSKDHIFHLDLKPANILLDKDGVPKLGDFGLSRLLGSLETFATKTNSGTFEYMPPEYKHAGRLISSKFDVFSLGIIIIQIIAGQEGYYKYKCIYTPAQEFIGHVTRNWSKRAMSNETLLEIQKCIEIAIRCVEDNREKRPTITEIVEELNMIDLHRVPLSW